MGNFDLSLHPKQMEVFKSDARFRVIVAGRRWGKTAMSKVLLIKWAAAKRKQMVWYIAPTYRMAKQIMWNDLLDSIPHGWIRKTNETSLQITLVNDSIISLKGADSPDSLRGVGLNFLVLDEYQDMAEEIWGTVLRPTLADKNGYAVMIGTPRAYNLLFDVYQLGQRGKIYKDENGVLHRNEWESWQFATETSPFIPITEIEAAKKDMDAKSFAQEFQASFEVMSGRVYYAFERAVHVGEYAFNPQLPLWVGMDFNIDPMSTIIFQKQDNGEVWAIDEIVRFGSNTEEICDELDKRYFRYQNNLTIYPDPAGGHRQHARGETDLDILREKGFKRIKYRRKHPPIADRVNAVNRLLRAADGTIRLRVDAKCKHFINSLEQTLYKPGTREIDKAASVEHSTDAGGYCIELEFPVRKLDLIGVSV